ncbi:GerAB/ArcD/ProY family transporter [Paenibacillus glycanilyticus]|uniref:Spore germination protein KB n=1 Tax=Paenibacillus glycanilyticus TaxID=126569 RepID=A0ABQ6GAI1_9BACL|nr:endospore germination permease [Paenibacillus glycanilyticus]GLX67966.1 spore germination protein KB [Paenibacillus glycanilyticus]
MDTSKLTIRQMTMWFILYQLGSAFLVLPSNLASIAKQDAWISLCLVLAVQLLMILVYGGIAKQLNGASFDQHLQTLLGQWLGKLLLLLFTLMYPFLILSLVLRDLGDYITTVILPETPMEVIFVLMLGVVIYVLYCGVSTIGRAAELLFFIVMGLLALGYLPLIPSANFTNLLPVFEFGWKPIVHASFTNIAFPYIESVLFLYFVSQTNRPEKWRAVVIKSSLISGFLFMCVTLIVIAVLSQQVVTSLNFPSYFVVRTISYSEFFERFEIAVSVIWFIAIFFRMSLLMYVSAKGIAAVFQLKDYRSLLIPFGLITFVIAGILWPNTAILITTYRAWPFYSMFFGIIFPILIWLTGLFKQRVSQP